MEDEDSLDEMPLSESLVSRACRLACAIRDGTLIPIDRLADERPYHSGEHRRHGMNAQVLADPAGRLVWASPALPGATHDLPAARTTGLIDALTTAKVETFADKGYQGAGGERAISTSKTWKVLTKLRCCPRRATSLVQAISVLQSVEEGRYSG